MIWWDYTTMVEGEADVTASPRRSRLMNSMVRLLNKQGAARAILLHEDPSDCATGGAFHGYPDAAKIMGWHGKANRHNLLFLDGHAAYTLVEGQLNRDHRTAANGTITPCGAPPAADCSHGNSNWATHHDYKQE